VDGRAELLHHRNQPTFQTKKKSKKKKRQGRNDRFRMNESEFETLFRSLIEITVLF